MHDDSTPVMIIHVLKQGVLNEHQRPRDIVPVTLLKLPKVSLGIVTAKHQSVAIATTLLHPFTKGEIKHPILTVKGLAS